MAVHRATLCFVSPIGFIEIQAASSGVTRIRLENCGTPREVGESGALAVARTAKNEILAFLEGHLRTFTVPVHAAGTPFQKAVWERLTKIPFGETRSYGAIADQLGKPRAARAVGAACGANPLPIIVPCHRVLGGNGALTGFAAGMALKVKLLEIEKLATAFREPAASRA